jgi:hypothetical protein
MTQTEAWVCGSWTGEARLLAVHRAVEEVLGGLLSDKAAARVSLYVNYDRPILSALPLPGRCVALNLHPREVVCYMVLVSGFLHHVWRDGSPAHTGLTSSFAPTCPGLPRACRLESS